MWGKVFPEFGEDFSPLPWDPIILSRSQEMSVGKKSSPNSGRTFPLFLGIPSSCPAVPGNEWENRDPHPGCRSSRLWEKTVLSPIAELLALSHGALPALPTAALPFPLRHRTVHRGIRCCRASLLPARVLAMRCTPPRVAHASMRYRPGHRHAHMHGRARSLERRALGGQVPRSRAHVPHSVPRNMCCRALRRTACPAQNSLPR